MAKSAENIPGLKQSTEDMDSLVYDKTADYRGLDADCRGIFSAQFSVMSAKSALSPWAGEW